jgi:hypothetical protein
MKENDEILVIIKSLEVRLSNDKKSHNSRVYVFHEGVGPSAMFGIANGARWSHPSALYRKFVLPRVRKEMNLGSEVSIRWSQKAGCSCGCSPGFIVNDGYGCQNVFVTVEFALKQPDLPGI